MKIIVIIIYLVANLYFFFNIMENRYGKALSSKQKIIGMALTFLVITAAFLPYFWGYGRNMQILGNFGFSILAVIFCGLWLLLRFKPGLYLQLRRYLIWLCCLLLFVLIMWPFICGR